MEIIYESGSIKIIFPLESTPYINIVHVHMLVSVHLLKSRKRWYLLSFCKSYVIAHRSTATFECRALIGRPVSGSRQSFLEVSGARPIPPSNNRRGRYRSSLLG